MGSCSRRHFIKKIGTGFLATCLVPATGWSALLPETTRRSLSFYNTHTGERLGVCYYRNGVYCPGAMGQINRILRDHRTGDIADMDARLMDLLFTVSGCVPVLPFTSFPVTAPPRRMPSSANKAPVWPSSAIICWDAPSIFACPDAIPAGCGKLA